MWFPLPVNLFSRSVSKRKLIWLERVYFCGNQGTECFGGYINNDSKKLEILIKDKILPQI